MVDFFNIINKDARLRKNMETAKKTVAVGEFNGPDGDYVCNLKRFTAYEKDNITSVIFEFRTVEDGSEYGNKKIVIFIKLDDGPLYTAEEAQGLMFQYIQLMGIDTNRKQKEIESDLTALTDNETQIIVRKKTTHKKKDGKSIDYKNYSIIGVNESPIEVVNTESNTPFDDTNETLEAGEAAEVDEWGEAEAAEPAAEETVTYKPSDYVGYDCQYKGKDCEILEATDEDNTVVIKDKKTGRKLKVTFDQLEWPES